MVGSVKRQLEHALPSPTSDLRTERLRWTHRPPRVPSHTGSRSCASGTSRPRSVGRRRCVWSTIWAARCWGPLASSRAD